MVSAVSAALPSFAKYTAFFFSLLAGLKACGGEQ